jgi:hypothetical protein
MVLLLLLMLLLLLCKGGASMLADMHVGSHHRA